MRGIHHSQRNPRLLYTPKDDGKNDASPCHTGLEKYETGCGFILQCTPIMLLKAKSHFQ
jgi:hypothetical protein